MARRLERWEAKNIYVDKLYLLVYLYRIKLVTPLDREALKKQAGNELKCRGAGLTLPGVGHHRLSVRERTPVSAREGGEQSRNAPYFTVLEYVRVLPKQRTEPFRNNKLHIRATMLLKIKGNFI